MELPDVNGPEFKACMYRDQILINTLTEQEKLLALMDEKVVTRGWMSRGLGMQKSKAAVDANLQATPSTFLAKIMLPVYTSLAIKFAQEQTYVNGGLIACEIERYKLAHGKLPATLEELHMTGLPHDVINGQPLHYRVIGDDNYLLYSVGWNETDEVAARWSR